MIAPSKCQDALNQVMISSSVKIHHVQPTTEICHLVTWGWSKTLGQTQPTTSSLSTSLRLPQLTSSSRSSQYTNVVGTLPYEDAFFRPISNILFQSAIMPCLYSLLSQIYLLHVHVQLEWVTCMQVSTLLLREDASGPQLAATLADHTCRCDLPQTWSQTSFKIWGWYIVRVVVFWSYDLVVIMKYYSGHKKGLVVVVNGPLYTWHSSPGPLVSHTPHSCSSYSLQYGDILSRW